MDPAKAGGDYDVASDAAGLYEGLDLIMGWSISSNLSDRQAADAVYSRIDWKYALSLPLTDPGFDHTVLCEFRGRLVEAGADTTLLDLLLEKFKSFGPALCQGASKN
jgi:transposase